MTTFEAIALFAAWIMAGIVGVGIGNMIRRLLWTLGWRPQMFQESVAIRTAAECASELLPADVTLTDEAKHEHLHKKQTAFRAVIERYVKNMKD